MIDMFAGEKSVGFTAVDVILGEDYFILKDC